ncbi:hypothetical protein CRUP_023209 [Coryphaenoides rupestris]|nr:hypothetical protein CRUP_023209 [Coryphaenoides rupestris]
MHPRRASWDGGNKSQFPRDDTEGRDSQAPRATTGSSLTRSKPSPGPGAQAGGVAEDFGSSIREEEEEGGGGGGVVGQTAAGSSSGGSGAQHPSRGRGPPPRDFVQVEDLQRGKPRRRNVSETLSETSEYEELPKRRRQKGAENGEGYVDAPEGVRKADRDSWRSNKVYAEDQAGRRGQRQGQGRGPRGLRESHTAAENGTPPLLPPPPTTSAATAEALGLQGYLHLEGAWRPVHERWGPHAGERLWPGDGRNRVLAPAAPCGLSARTLKYPPKFPGVFTENGAEERDGEYYVDGESGDRQALRRRRPPRQDKPPRFRRLRQEKRARLRPVEQ